MRGIMRLFLLFVLAGMAVSVLNAQTSPLLEAKFSNKKNLPGPLIDDRAFLRRVWLDMTGRLPEQQVVDSFMASSNPNKRRDMIDSIIASEAYVDRFTTFFEDLFWNPRIVERANFRNAFHAQLRDDVEKNIPIDVMARELMTFSGKGWVEQSGMTFWLFESFDEDYRLDFLDDQVGYISETMLGVQINCISCHDGAFHLEQVNKGLSTMKREQFWGMASFLAESYLYIPYEDIQGADDDEDAFIKALQFIDRDADFNEDEGFLLADEGFADGEYRAISEAGDGMRTPRNGGVIQPAYLWTGEKPQPGENRRQALARMITKDRQFARNMVNRVWAHFFGQGFVEPLNGWDMGRIDHATAQTYESTVQARDAGVMEALTDFFIQSQFNIQALVRHIVNSEVYQWDYQRTTMVRKDESLAYWRQNHRVRRLEAEAIADSMFQVLGWPRKYMVIGYLDRVYNSTWQLPGTDEPAEYAIFGFDEDGDQLLVDPTTLGYESLDEYLFLQYSTKDLLTSLGRGDHFNRIGRSKDMTVQNALLLLNKYDLNFWLENWENIPLLKAATDQIEQNNATPEQVSRFLFHRTLYREPTPNELSRFVAHFQDRETGRAVADLVWVLFNHPDFLFK